MDHLIPEIAAFLATGTRTGKLGWTGVDGRPLVAPVWFVGEDGELLFSTGKETAKGRAVRRDRGWCCASTSRNRRMRSCRCRPRQ